MNRTLLFVSLVLFLCVPPVAAQKAKLPNTLLWRISGKAGAKPSYLFGTMHVKDRRVFQFSDSLYHFLQNAEGYAMEIDPDEAMAALFKTLSDLDTTALLKDEMKGEDFKKVAGDLEKKFGIPANRITKKQAWLYKMGGEYNSRTKPDDMDAAVDLYLYNIAKHSGKWVGGIEDIEDQFDVIGGLGAAFDTDELLLKGNSAAELEKMVQVYIAQDLNKIDAFVNAMSASTRDKLLLQRNHKMARRMDSLFRLRSHFFAVGAAHLPGTEGVLQLLEKQGYTVQPVFSKKTVAPQNYSYAKKELPWQITENEEKTYAVSMPGKASVVAPNEMMKMRIYADLGTGLIYFITNFTTPPGRNEDSVLHAAAKNMMGKKGVSRPETILYNGAKGLEMLRDSGGYFYRVRLLPNGSQMVMTMVGSQKRSQLYGEEAQRFYNSLILTPPKVQPPKSKEAWHVYRDERLAVEVSFPDTPTVNRQIQHNFQQREDAAWWRFYNQTCLDERNNAYYMFLAKETAPGYYLISDAVLFDEARKATEAKNEIAITRYDTGRWQGLPAMWMDGRYRQNNLLMKSLTVNRGNRGYTLMAIYDAAGDTTAAAHFLASLQLPPFKETQWQSHTDPTQLFTTTAPDAIHVQQKDSTGSTANGLTAVSYDSLSGFSYQVVVEPIPPFFWTANDTAFFAHAATEYIGTADSLISVRTVTNGAASGREYLVRMEEGRNFKKLRFLLNGDSVYLLHLVGPEAYITGKMGDRFFDDFRFVPYRTAKNVFQNKSAQLIAALQTGDSALFEQAKAYIAKAPFAPADLPRIHQALLHPYRDFEEGSYGVHNDLIEAAISLSDTATINFIKQQFPALKGENEALKYPFLKALAGIKKDFSYEVLKELLLHHTPAAGNSNGLGYRLRDSLLLTKKLFPQVLALSSDSLFCNVLTDIIPTLIDSNLSQLSDVMPYAKNFRAHAEKKWQSVNRSSGEEAWILYDDIQLLEKLNSKESNALLQKFSQSKYMDVQQPAVMALLTNKQPVATPSIEKVAANKYYRITLYEHLKKLGRLSLFPAKYATQKSIAESILYQYASDDEEPSKLMFLGERAATYMGKKGTFYLFKVEYPYENSTYLGITGPFVTGSKTIVTAPEVLGMPDDVFDPKQIDTQLKAYLQELEEYYATKEE